MALHLTTSMGLFSVDGIDRSVSVTIGVYKPCIDQGIDFYTWHRAFFKLQNNVTVNSKRRVVNCGTL